MTAPELLAPAGSEEALHAAVMSGADAVYLGGYKFNARRSAANFDKAAIIRCVRMCHIYGVKVYVTVNTLVKENETRELEEYARFLSDAGVDAVIVQDIGAAVIIMNAAPELELHASTQMTVTSLSGVKFLEGLGFKRVVLARELTKEQIEYISSGTDTELEVFVHGALCMCYSGQCLMSSLIGGRSGNRGMCAQPCRLPYEITEKGNVIKKGFLLSPKDLCLADDIKAMKELGIASLKIEGRLKRPEYVAAVTGIYRKYLDDTRPVSRADMRELADAFNRGGFTRAYFGGETGGAMMSYDNPGNASGNVFSDEVKKIAAGGGSRHVPVRLSAELAEGKRLFVSYTDSEDHTAEAQSESCAVRAEKKPVSAQLLEERLRKTGATAYEVTEAEVKADGVSILAAAEINAARRTAAERLDDMRAAMPERKTAVSAPKARTVRTAGAELAVYALTREQAETAAALGVRRIYAHRSVLRGLDCEEPVETLMCTGSEGGSFENVLIQNTAQLYNSGGRQLYGSFRLNIMNSYSADFFGMMKLVTVSPELNVSDIAALAEHTSVGLEVIAYGRLPLMLMRNCPLKAAGVCQKHTDRYRLRDRKGYEFPICCTEDCTAQLLNSKAIYTADRLTEILSTGIDSISLMFTDESGAECKRIIKEYQTALSGGTAAKMRENEYTRGHFFRGIEV